MPSSETNVDAALNACGAGLLVNRAPTIRRSTATSPRTSEKSFAQLNAA
eukprot:CAMPEP_0196791258 /NCGR_PEP_ID=MMETSP1104-20130614/29581_1 /TAXON_ID=33652 /ORGANISM="Cafeteria sp., Strain Caron Lab Isolate" /LENGTH=48 /DNA_ID= /DNA_START= /DNA_END= /DNA_ORIENTATION=